jgi:environmental stress-induced protein Ves
MNNTLLYPKVLRKYDYTTTQWSGGETTELLIFPLASNFSDRQFDFRISIATINVNESNFTALPGIQRTLLLLEGELQLEHKHHHTSHLLPFDQDSFEGSWETHCLGSGTDMNVMTKSPYTCSVSVSESGPLHSTADFVVGICLSTAGIVGSIELSRWEGIWWDNRNQLSVNADLKEGRIAWIEIKKTV